MEEQELLGRQKWERYLLHSLMPQALNNGSQSLPPFQEPLPHWEEGLSFLLIFTCISFNSMISHVISA